MELSKEKMLEIAETKERCIKCEKHSCLNCDNFICANKTRSKEIAFYEKVRELLQADAEGRLVVLPCKVGTKRLYFIDDDREIYIIDAEEVTIKRMPSGKTIFEYDSCEFEYKEFGKNAFLTIEEAEAALEKMGDLRND